MNTEPDNTNKGSLEEQAIAWHVRLNGGAAAEADWLAFTTWLEADPSHNEAYDHVALAWDTAGQVAPSFETLTDKQGGNVVSLAFARLKKTAQARPVAFGGGFGAAIAATLMLLVAPTLITQNDVLDGVSYATGIGEQRNVTLADGSTIMLNTNTALEVTYGKKARNVHLTKGEAFFTVHHDAARPFVVAANDISITDVGTRFNVRADTALTQVSVTEGIVDVKVNPTADSFQAKRLKAGDQAVREAGKPLTVSTFDAERLTAWQQGQLVFDNDNLGTVTAELNRYFTRPVKLADAGLDQLRFSGVLQIADQNKAVRDLTLFLNLRAEENQHGIMLYQSAQPHRN